MARFRQDMTWYGVAQQKIIIKKIPLYFSIYCRNIFPIHELATFDIAQLLTIT